jgi:GAF domain-containing protein
VTARSIPVLLALIADVARDVVAAHQAATSLAPGGRWAKAAHAFSLSDKYAAWRTYDETPDGSGIYRLVQALNRPLRLTQAELERHPAWRAFGAAAGRHPPMRGWLAAPLHGRDGRGIGVVQLTDKIDGEFTAEDEARLVAIARLASVALDELRQRALIHRRASATRAPARTSRAAPCAGGCHPGATP